MHLLQTFSESSLKGLWDSRLDRCAFAPRDLATALVTINSLFVYYFWGWDDLG